MNDIEPIMKSCHFPGDEKWARHKMSSTLLRTDIPLTLGTEYVYLGSETCLMAIRCALKIWFSLRGLIIIYQFKLVYLSTRIDHLATSSAKDSGNWVFTEL